jgi:hypothetical protein
MVENELFPRGEPSEVYHYAPQPARVPWHLHGGRCTAMKDRVTDENCDDLDSICSRISGELRELAVLLSSGGVTHEHFMRAVLAVEANHVRRANLTLTASETIDHWTVFILRDNRTKEVCAAFEFLPETGEFRRVSKLSGY